MVTDGYHQCVQHTGACGAGGSACALLGSGRAAGTCSTGFEGAEETTGNYSPAFSFCWLWGASIVCIGVLSVSVISYCSKMLNWLRRGSRKMSSCPFFKAVVFLVTHSISNEMDLKDEVKCFSPWNHRETLPLAQEWGHASYWVKNACNDYPLSHILVFHIPLVQTKAGRSRGIRGWK